MNGVIRQLNLNDPDYPEGLRQLVRPPDPLFLRGTLLPADAAAVAIVGTRAATPYGLAAAERLARELAQRGITVVSGLAEGIDGAAHRGALSAGGRTIAVLGHGLNFLYPAIHRHLAEAIADSGALVSQFPVDLGPLKPNFPQRNRVIAGLSLGVVIVEAPERSGALITAREALEAGREVFVVPGPAGSPKHRGSHRLIQDGAKLVETADDILVELAPTLRAQLNDWKQTATEDGSGTGPRLAGKLAGVDELMERIVEAVPVGTAVSVDALAAAFDLPAGRMLAKLTRLELAGRIRPALGQAGFTRLA